MKARGTDGQEALAPFSQAYIDPSCHTAPCAMDFGLVNAPPGQQVRQDEHEVVNSAGGFVYAVDDMARALRFLILGTEGGTYYVNKQQLRLGNAQCIVRLLEAGRGPELVDLIISVSAGGRAAQQMSTMLALALCAKRGDAATKKQAFGALRRVCRIPTHLFCFIEQCTRLSPGNGKGFGRAQQRAVAEWYNSKAAPSLAFMATKYMKRGGWSHRDVLRLGHVKPTDRAHNALYAFLTEGKSALSKPGLWSAPSHEQGEGQKGQEQEQEQGQEQKQEQEQGQEQEQEQEQLAEIHHFLSSLKQLNSVQHVNDVVNAIRELNLAREHVPTHFLSKKKVWMAMLPGMPITALMRNLATMTRIGLFSAQQPEQFTAQQPESDANDDSVGNSNPCKLPKLCYENTQDKGRGKKDRGDEERKRRRQQAIAEDALTQAEREHALEVVCQKLTSAENIRRGKVHPFNALLALKTYSLGCGFRSSQRWSADPRIQAALETAYANSFAAVEPTGQNFLLALDVSGSMGSRLMNSPLTAMEASAAMAVITRRTEEHVHVVAFAQDLVPFDFAREATVEEVSRATRQFWFGATDCALPMLYAKHHRMDVDVFVVYTDSETWIGDEHPAEALRDFRRVMNKPSAKLIVVAMTSSGFTIADPNDRGMLDVVGFDTNTPLLMAEFARGNL